jgi:hypothetical protein
MPTEKVPMDETPKKSGVNVLRSQDAEQKAADKFHAAWLAEQTSSAKSETGDVEAATASKLYLNQRGEGGASSLLPEGPAHNQGDEGSQITLAERRAEVEDFFHLSKKAAHAQEEAAEDAEAKLAEKRKEVEAFFGLSKKDAPDTSVQKTPGQQAKSFVVHDVYHDRNYGAAMHVVERTPHKSKKPFEEQVTEDLDARLAERRAENSCLLGTGVSRKS